MNDPYKAYQPPLQIYSQAKVLAVYEMLAILAGKCDGAVKRDQAGFNKLDADLGQDLSHLAETVGLTHDQVRLAIGVCRKYKRQIPEEIYQAVYLEEGLKINS